MKMNNPFFPGEDFIFFKLLNIRGQHWHVEHMFTWFLCKVSISQKCQSGITHMSTEGSCTFHISSSFVSFLFILEWDQVRGLVNVSGPPKVHCNS